MNAVDTSVLVAGFSPWHDVHEPAREALDTEPRAIAHSLVEAYSVLTRLPAPFPAEAHIVAGFLTDLVGDDEPLTLSAASHRTLPSQLAVLGIDRGAVYDGLIALTCVEHQATLLTLDGGAHRTYRACGVDLRYL